MSSRIRLLALLFGIAAASAAYGAVPEPRLLRVQLAPGVTASTLADAGLDVVSTSAASVRILEHPGDLARLARFGVSVEVLDEHPGRTLAARTRAELLARRPEPSLRVRSAARADGVFRIESLPPFGSGSLGGFWNGAEIKMKLDELVANDANDVVASKIDTLGYTWQGRPIWGLKIGKTVVGPDSRPVVFFNAITHAREPEGMQTMFYFIDDLLSGYGADPFKTYLLDNRVIYIVPLVNPDGYAINEATYVNSGGSTFGYWRKNARDNDGNSVIDGNDGVDLNRNYSYHWGDPGAGTLPADETYRGPSAASEPETQVQRNAVVALHPVTGLSFHTYSDLMIYPWGYTASAPLDAAAFKEWSDELTRDNGYLSGQAPSILYGVSGEFNDWAYGDTIAKPRMYSWTPEIGSPEDDFWPPPSRIVPLAQENLRACYVVAAIAGPYVQENGVTILEGAMNAGNLAHFMVRVRNLGIYGVAGTTMTATLIPLDLGVNVLRGSVACPTLGSRQSADALQTFQVAVDDTVTPGRRMRFRLEFTTTGGFFSRDTIAIPCGTPTVLVTENCDTLISAKWSRLVWNVVKNDPDHPSRYFGDSPTGGYGASINNTLALRSTLNLSQVLHAYAIFDAAWEFEADYDGGFVEASSDGINFTSLPSTTSTPASGVSLGAQGPIGSPVFAGARQLWKTEVADLSAFTGAGKTAVRFRYRVASDAGNAYGQLYDGLNIDSLRIVLYDPAAQPAPVAVGDATTAAALEFGAPMPNPAHGPLRFSFALPRASHARIEVLDLQGRRVRLLGDGPLRAGRYAHGWDLRDDAGRAVPPGVYLARLATEDGSRIQRIVVIH